VVAAGIPKDDLSVHAMPPGIDVVIFKIYSLNFSAKNGVFCSNYCYFFAKI
jgi:hypothetical protein